MSNPKSGSKKYAVRNLRLCTKDCLCLYVCPTGATDTENSIIDTDKCLGCGTCAAACPSAAISMVPVEYPPQQKKEEKVLAASYALAKSKAKQEKMALQLAEAAEEDGLYRLMTAMSKSIRLVNEDLMRESGYMLPQSGNTHRLLRSWIENPPSPEFPIEAAKKLLELIPCNDCSDDNNYNNKGENKKMSKWKCKVCGYIYEGEELPADFKCPVCKQPASSFEKIEEAPKTNKYAGTQTEKNLEAAFAVSPKLRQMVISLFWIQEAEPVPPASQLPTPSDPVTSIVLGDEVQVQYIHVEDGNLRAEGELLVNEHREDGETAFLTDPISGREAEEQSRALQVLSRMGVLG